MIKFYVPAVSVPLTNWQRTDRFATMRDAQRKARALRGEADFMARVSSMYDRDDVSVTNQEAAMWEDLALWLGRSVREAYTPTHP